MKPGKVLTFLLVVLVLIAVGHHQLSQISLQALVPLAPGAGNADTNTNPDPHFDSNPDSNTHTNTHTNSHTNSDADATASYQ